MGGTGLEIWVEMWGVGGWDLWPPLCARYYSLTCSHQVKVESARGSFREDIQPALDMYLSANSIDQKTYLHDQDTGKNDE